ncbi:MAG: DUF445 domain-containing protein [Alphaproteobacteria bacterium]|nr:DUF445 domain-containing protein [Alphaproteobacteria bacterium]
MTFAGTEGDDGRRAELGRHKRRATGLLLAMGAGFVGTSLIPDPGFGWQLARAAAEAGVVGGLADWFAVTALFRRPLGLPIPHTAIIPTHKDRIGEGLGRFVERHFLDPELVATRLRRADPAGLLARWLADPAHARAVADRLAAALPRLLDAAGDAELRRFLHEALGERLARADLVPAAVRLFETVTNEGHHLRLFDDLLVLVDEQVGLSHDRILSEVASRSAWYVPKMVDRAIAERLVNGLRAYLAELREPGHPTRANLDRAFRNYLDRLQHDPAFRQQLAGVRDRLLKDPQTREWIEAAWAHAREAVLADLARPESRLRAGLAAGLVALAEALGRDEAIRAGLNDTAERFVLAVIVPARAEIGRFITDVVKSWDAALVTDRVEVAFGRDLQYIRLNGTLVGALIGAGLFLLAQIWAGQG